jgi:amidase
MTGLATEVATLDAVAQANLVRSGQVTATELVRGAIDRIEALNPTLNAVITPTFDSALAAAATVPATGPLSGVPFLVKDLVVEIAGVPFHEGSRFLSDHVSTYDSEIVRRWRRAGLVILGKTNCPEFGMVPATEPLSAGATRNPWTSADRPAAHPEARPRPSRRAWSRSRTATTPAGRCNPRRRRAACSGSSRPVRAIHSARSTATPSPVGPANMR